MTEPRAILSVDAEFLGHTPAYRSADAETEGFSLGTDGLDFLLDAFDKRDVTTTFFVVSDLVDRVPEQIAAIDEAGHEIGSHTQTHQLLSSLSAEKRRAEIAESRDVLSTVASRPVEGFRAPAFDRGEDHFEMVAESGYTYDSSVCPARRIPGWYGGSYDVHTPCPVSTFEAGGPELTEVPASVMPGVRLPLTGLWVRLFGRRYTALGMGLLARRGITPVLYIHPWELADIPKIEGLPRRMYWRTGAWMRQTVEYLLDKPFEYVSVRETLDA